MLRDAHWMRLEPLIEACRPKGKTPFGDGRQGYSAPKARQQAADLGHVGSFCFGGSWWARKVDARGRTAGGMT